MWIIVAERIRDWQAERPDAAGPLGRWLTTARAAAWRDIGEVRRDFPHADTVTVRSGSTVTVFNVGGNKYRLIVALHYDRQRAYMLRFLTHAEYDKDFWKDQL